MTSQLDKENLPEHIAIIMDGNGRWAKAKKSSPLIWSQCRHENIKENCPGIIRRRHKNNHNVCFLHRKLETESGRS